MLDSLCAARNNIFYKMYVHNVSNRLREMETPSDIDCQRWPWELMQNAKDSISGSKRNSINIILKIEKNSVTFQHDGNPFTSDTYYALIFKYSEGKKNNSESTGRFGTGFLTTHSLSKVVSISGPILDENKNKIIGFEVKMYRDGKNEKELIDGLIKTEKERKLFENKSPKWTIFKYELKTKRNQESKILGKENFEKNIILAMAFNDKFNNIQLIDSNKELIYKKIGEKSFNNDILLKEFSINNKSNNKIIKKHFLYSKINEESKELTEHFNTKRFLNLECAIEINPENKEIIININSPSLFCSLPLVGSEKHILPFILNSNDFEPSTERQEILLAGAETIKDDKNNNKIIISDVGINRYILKRSFELFDKIVSFCSSNKYNNLHLLSRGLKDINKLNKYFDEKWYEDYYIKEMRKILCKYPIIYDLKNKLSLIKNIFIPIYSNYNNDFTKLYYEIVKELFEYVPRYQESINWSKYIWENDLENNLIDIYKCINKYNHSNYNIDFKNKFIKFVFDYYKDLLKTNTILINQKNNFILYDENEFAQSINVPEDIINCIEELGYNWREKHLSNNINSIELPIRHDYDYAIILIRKEIEKDKNKSYILIRYVQNNNEIQSNIFYFSKIFFPEKIKDKIIVNNFIDKIYEITNLFIVEQILNIIENIKNISKISEIHLDIETYNKLLNVLYLYNDKIFNERKILPSINGEFKYINDLNYEININVEIKNIVINDIGFNINEILLNKNIQIKNLNIKHFYNNNLIEIINEYLKSNFQNNFNNCLKISKIIIKYLPNENNNNYKDIRDLYQILANDKFSDKILETKYDSIWTNVKIIILEEIQKSFLDNNKIIFKNESGKEGYIKIGDTKITANLYIDLLNKHQKYLNFEEYALIPNYYGKFKKIKDLMDYNEIPEDIINGIKKTFNKDLYKYSIFKGIKINNINKKSLLDIGTILEDYFGQIDSYDKTYDLCKIIIKYIPKKVNKEYQTRLYNLCKIFIKNIENSIEVESNDILYNQINKGIIQYINESLSKYGSVQETQKYINNIYILINDNSDILDPKNYAIIPNQLGIFKKISDLYIGIDLVEELIDIYQKHENIKSILMDNKIKNFKPDNTYTNETLKKNINNLITQEIIKVEEILILIPKEKKEKQKDIKFIYENIFLKGKELKETIINVENSFWEETNKITLTKILLFFNNDRKLKDICEDEEKAIKIIEIIYKYLNPQTNEYENEKLVPNQNGNLCLYNDLYIEDEIEINKNFKLVLKNYFDYDICNSLIHKKLKLKSQRILKIGERIAEKINLSLSNTSEQEKKLEKAKILLKFYPKKEKDGKNIIKEFIDCYITLSGEKIEVEELETESISIWEKSIQILLKELIKIIHKDANIQKTSERIGLNEEQITTNLNKLYYILFEYFKDDKEFDNLNFVPNEKGIYMQLCEVYENKDIDDGIKEILILINKNRDFNDILIHKKIKLSKIHQQKTLKNITEIIDIEFKIYYNSLDSKIDVHEISENSIINNKQKPKIEERVKTSWKKLTNEWLIKNKDKKNYFSYISKHICEITFKLLDEEYSNLKNQIESLMMSNPNEIMNYIFKNPNQELQQINRIEPIIWREDSLFLDENDRTLINSLDQTRDNSRIGNNINLNNFNNLINNNYNHNHQNLNNNNNMNIHINNNINHISNNNNNRNIINNNRNIINNNRNIINNNNNGVNYNNSINNINNNNNIFNNINYNNNNNRNNNIINNNNNNINRNNNNINNYNNNSDVSNNISNNININNNSNYLDLKKYYLCQGYVYENLKNSNLFKEIDWKNKVRENEEGEEITLLNQNKYKVKKPSYEYDFIAITNQDKKFYISVKRGKKIGSHKHLYFGFKKKQWDLFEEEQICLILAFVRLLENQEPQIFYARNDKINNII